MRHKLPMNPYTSATGPPLMRPADIVVQDASHVAMIQTLNARTEPVLKFF